MSNDSNPYLLDEEKYLGQNYADDENLVQNRNEQEGNNNNNLIFENIPEEVTQKVPTPVLEKYFEKARFPNVDIIYVQGTLKIDVADGTQDIDDGKRDVEEILDKPEGLSNFNEVFQQFEKTRKQTDLMLAHASKFLPEESFKPLVELYEFVLCIPDQTKEEDLKSGINIFLQVQEDLKKETSPLSGHEAEFLRSQITNQLQITYNLFTTQNDPHLLPTSKLEHFESRLEELDNAENMDPLEQVESLRTLYNDINNAIEAQLKIITDLSIDFEQLQPSIDRALQIYTNRKMEQEKSELTLKVKQLSEGQIKGEEALRKALREIREEVSRLLHDTSLEEKMKFQSDAIPVKPNELKVDKVLGHGAFGDVIRLTGPEGIRLAAKSSNDTTEGIEDMQHELEIYARLGEHPNIVKCFGIHNIEGKPMMIMEEIEGGDLNKIFGKLENDYRDKKISRSEFLGGMQHLIKGTLQGLAHFESHGIVHKDIKGNNIRLDKNNQPVVLDVGLSQDVSNKHQNVKSYYPNAPTEQFVSGLTENKVSNLWDSFSLGKMIFPVMEQSKSGNQKFQFVPGKERPMPSVLSNRFGSVDPIGMDLNGFEKANRQAFEVDEDGQVVPKKDEKGNISDMALKPSKTPGQVKPGEYDVLSFYVDFMCMLTHPDPKQRLSPSEALKHPFLTQSLIDEKKLGKLFGTEPPPKVDKKDDDEPKSLDDLQKIIDKDNKGSNEPENLDDTQKSSDEDQRNDPGGNHNDQDDDAQDKYVDKGYGDNKYVDKGYGDNKYVDQRYGDNKYVQKGYGGKNKNVDEQDFDEDNNSGIDGGMRTDDKDQVIEQNNNHDDLDMSIEQREETDAENSDDQDPSEDGGTSKYLRGEQGKSGYTDDSEELNEKLRRQEDD